MLLTFGGLTELLGALNGRGLICKTAISHRDHFLDAFAFRSCTARHSRHVHFLVARLPFLSNHCQNFPAERAKPGNSNFAYHTVCIHPKVSWVTDG